MIHLQILGHTQETANHGIYFAVYLIVFLIMITGGRVIPFFTETAIKGVTLSKWPAVEYFSLGGFLLLITLDMTGANPLIIVIVATLVAIAHSLRLFGWYQRAIWSHPLLWVLYLAYFWLIAGLLLKALAAAGFINPMLALHAFTTGTIGTMTLGMMVRVTLGHTGRELHPQITTILAFVLVNLAALSRVFLPILFPAGYALWVVLAGLLWSTAFAIFVLSYSGFLIQARIDGKPG